MSSRYFLSRVFQNAVGLMGRSHLNLLNVNHLRYHIRYLSPRYLSLSNKIIHQKHPQYEYDPATDTFRPKEQQGFMLTNQGNKQRSTFQNFLRKWTRTIFLITGGIVWGAIVFVALFVDVKDSNNSFQFPPNHDLEEEVRSIVFYNLAQGKNDLARIVSMHENKDNGLIEDIHDSMHVKHEVLLKVFERVQNDEMVINALGGHPVQMCGFRVAGRIATLIQDFQDIALDFKSGKTDNLLSFDIDATDQNTVLNTWSAECIIEGKDSLGVLLLDFEREDPLSPWILKECIFRKLGYLNKPIRLTIR